MNTSRISHDHDALCAGVDAIRGLMQMGIAENAAAIASELGKLTAAIRLHLSIEDRFLYPALARAADPHVAATGRRFQQEMGGLARTYQAFAARWEDGAAIAAAPEQFRRDADAAFDALQRRIALEAQELLPLAETL
jgi:hemerythrin-like domain-containing protein